MKLVRRLASGLMLLMVMGVLAACGGSAADAQSKKYMVARL